MQALVRILPDFLVKFFARPYVAGDSLEQGLAATRDLLESRGLLTTFDLLSEDIETQEQARIIHEVYREMVEACSRFPDPSTRPSVSLKPSSFTTDPLHGGDGATADGSEEAIRSIVDLARERQVQLTIDMEDRHWTDWTLDLLRRLVADGHDHVGTVLQTRLNRTEEDLLALPDGVRIRLVIGIYVEPKGIAIRDKKLMKERMLRAARVLLERGHYVEFATHDEPYLRRFLLEVVPQTGVGPDRYEVQMLYGVPRERFQARLVRGEMGGQGPVRTRLYVPFATSWKHAIAYCRRRLVENPSIASAVGHNILRSLFGRR